MGEGSRCWLRARVTRATAAGGESSEGGESGEGGEGSGDAVEGGGGGEEGARCDLAWLGAEGAAGAGAMPEAMPEALVLAVWRGVNWRYASAE